MRAVRHQHLFLLTLRTESDVSYVKTRQDLSRSVRAREVNVQRRSGSGRTAAVVKGRPRAKTLRLNTMLDLLTQEGSHVSKSHAASKHNKVMSRPPRLPALKILEGNTEEGFSTQLRPLCRSLVLHPVSVLRCCCSQI